MDNLAKNIPRTFKIIILGDANVGKTSFFMRYLTDEFEQSVSSTIGVNNNFKEVIIDNHPVHLQIWDTAGQERFKSLVSQFYRDADGFIFMYDVTIRKSFGKMKTLIEELEGLINPKYTVLIGNQIDRLEENEIEKEKIEEEKDILKEFANKNKFKWFFTSAKTGKNVNEVFEYLSRALYYNKESKPKTKNLLSVIKRKRKFCF